MVLRARGLPADEDSVCHGWQGSGHGFYLREVETSLPDAKFINLPIDRPELTPTVRAYLDGEHWLIANVYTVELARIAARRKPPSVSQYGPLPDFGLALLHAVVFTSAGPAGFYYLDPYFPAAGQPYVMSTRELVDVVMGWAVVCAVRPSMR